MYAVSGVAELDSRQEEAGGRLVELQVGTINSCGAH